ncbi:thioesterase family protein [Pseudobacillus sp. FSL P4-0506]|uniref:acyl-CoA thioesterase n=1 Tax=unclassified Pseudobacillus TaxID=2619284 RepID=UPI0030FC52CE
MKKFSYIEDFEQWQKGFSFFHPIKVRFSETDMFGHLNNTVPFVYFEEARIEFLAARGLKDEWLSQKSESIPVVADLQCDFLEQVFFGEKLSIGVKVDSFGRSSCDIHYKGTTEDGRVCFVGRGTLVQISPKTGKAISFTTELKEKLLGQ